MKTEEYEKFWLAFLKVPEVKKINNEHSDILADLCNLSEKMKIKQAKAKCLQLKFKTMNHKYFTRWVKGEDFHGKD